MRVKADRATIDLMHIANGRPDLSSNPIDRGCKNGPDYETGEWPCDPEPNGDGTATCSVCQFTGRLP